MKTYYHPYLLMSIVNAVRNWRASSLVSVPVDNVFSRLNPFLKSTNTSS